ncbi:hypothetical protein OF83DRAFT_1167141 [Amylostereum chailletii]|nr:hypothetical protein OF83DRAFT_1167141 [Amylostereum chailletii]
MTHWTAPPTRRELTLLLICVTIFVCAYNAETTLRLVGLSDSSLVPFSSTRAPPIGPDGRRPEAYRDALENEIFGEWDWDAGRIAGVKAAEEERVKGGSEHRDRYVHGEGKTGVNAMWLQGLSEGKYISGDGLGSTTVNDDFIHWGDEVPRTKLVSHVPGFTIVDNLTMSFGTFFLVTDDPSSLPKADAIASSSLERGAPPNDFDWQILPAGEATAKLGNFGGRMHGVTFLSYDGSNDGYTLLSLQRLYSTLNDTSPPHRLLIPAVPTFSDPKPDPDDGEVPRQRSSLGVHPYTLKAAYPSLSGPLFTEDFDDFTGLNAPIILDRAVIVDRGASFRAGQNGAAAWTRPFVELDAPETWFEPIRRNLAAYFGLPKGGDKGAVEVTYLSRQVEGPPLRREDHDALVKGLKRLSVKVHIVDETTPWTDRMQALVRSSIVIGAYGDHLSSSVFMNPSPSATLMEFFPSGAFVSNWAVVMRSMGINYVAWQGTQKFTSDALPAVTRPSGPQNIHIDAAAVVRAVSEELTRHV